MSCMNSRNDYGAIFGGEISSSNNNNNNNNNNGNSRGLGSHGFDICRVSYGMRVEWHTVDKKQRMEETRVIVSVDCVSNGHDMAIVSIVRGRVRPFGRDNFVWVRATVRLAHDNVRVCSSFYWG